MSDNVEISLTVNASDANAAIDATDDKIKRVINEWFYARRVIISEIQQTVATINRMIGMARQVMSIFGEAIPPFYSALISMVMSTVATLLSISAALAATGVGIPASVAISVIAVGINAVLIAKLVKDEIEANRYSHASITRINHASRVIMSKQRETFGEGF